MIIISTVIDVETAVIMTILIIVKELMMMMKLEDVTPRHLGIPFINSFATFRRYIHISVNRKLLLYLLFIFAIAIILIMIIK